MASRWWDEQVAQQEAEELKRISRFVAHALAGAADSKVAVDQAIANAIVQGYLGDAFLGEVDITSLGRRRLARAERQLRALSVAAEQAARLCSGLAEIVP